MQNKKLRINMEGRILYGEISEDNTHFIGGAEDVTEECITAVASHMLFIASHNMEDLGYCQYSWDDVGVLTWETKEKMEANNAIEKMVVEPPNKIMS